LRVRTGRPELPVYPLQVKRYADDLQVLHTYTQLTENPALGRLDLANTTFLVVDDVLFEGHSLLRTCAYLAQLGARRVHYGGTGSTGMSVSSRSGPTLSVYTCKSPPLILSNATYRPTNRPFV
jgi:hypothetical protein